jgi:ADP-ribosylglycohydrolase
MQAGENTLDALVTRVLTKSMVKQQQFDVNDFRSEYILFMTTPGSHNDTYAGTCHRMFFKNLVNGKSPEDCPDNDQVS